MTESILSLFVLTTGLLSVTALIIGSLRTSFDNRDVIVGVELSQEGAEIVRNVRDNGFLKNSSNPFEKFSSTNKNCRISYDALYAGIDCTSSISGDYSLKYDTSGFYQHNSGSPTKFSRYLFVDYDGTKATVKSFVFWGGASAGMFTVGDAGTTGNTTNCTVSKKCVFTEISLANWK